MKTLLISDTHIGDPRYTRDSALANLLANESFDQIVLVGDVIDLWVPWWKSDTKQSKFITALNKLNTKIIWVIGNHDHNINTRDIVPTAVACDYYKFIDNKQEFLAIHGHQVYPFKNMGWHSKLLTLLDVYLFKWFNINVQALKDSWFNNIRVCKRRNQVMDRYGHLAPTIIIGHTHVQAHQSKNNIDIYDLGSILLNGTYGVIENGEFSFKKIKE